MAVYYVRSTDGNNSDNGTTWALAKATLTGAMAAAVAGDTIYVSQVHAETAASSSFTSPGTLASPLNIICGNDAAQPPTAVAVTGSVAGTNGTTIVAGTAYLYGMKFLMGAGGTVGSLVIGQGGTGKQVLEKCVFDLSPGNTSTSYIYFGQNNSSTSSAVEVYSSDMKFGAAGQGITLNGAKFKWNGGVLLSGGTSPTSLIVQVGEGSHAPGVAILDSLDLSNGGSTMNLIANNALAPGVVTFRNCKLPASWTGKLIAAAPSGAGFRAEMFNCDSGSTNYRLWTHEYMGEVVSEIVDVKTGGATDGTTGLSWKMISNANTKYPMMPLKSPEIVKWNETTGSSVTVTVDILHDSTTALNNNEVWLEVQYLSASGTPLGTFIDNRVADILATAAAQTTSTATWTTTGITNVNKQKLAVTFTPQKKGFIHAVVHLAKATYTIYVDPVLQ